MADESAPIVKATLAADTAEGVIDRAAHIAAAGMPLSAGLRAAAEEVDSRKLARALRRVADEVDRGRTLEDIVANSRRLPPHVAGLIRAAQRTPRLPVVLAEWLAHRRAAGEHWRQIEMALAYPAICILLALAVLVLFATFVVPMFSQMFEEFELKLPKLTVYFLWYCQVVVPVLTYVTGTAFVALIALRLIGGRAGWSWFMASVPLVGLPWHWAGVSELLHCLSLLIEQRVPLPEALRLTGGGISDAYLGEQCRRLADRVEGGASLTRALVEQRTLPLSIVPLVHWGEGRGTLAESLRSAAEMIENRLKVRSGVLTQVLPPILLLLVGSFIGSAMLSLFMPLIDLITGLS